MHTRTHKIHHGPNLGEITTFPFIVLFMFGHGGCTQMSFCPEIGSSEIPSIEILAILEAHNFSFRPPIGMRSKTKLYSSSKAF
jgi:hypothetical protein